MLRLVLFDCDGTLVDSAAVIVAAMTGAFTTHGLDAPPPEAIRAIVGLSLPVAVATLAAGREDAPLAALAAAYAAHYRNAVDADTVDEPTYPGTHETLAALGGENTLLGVVTGKSRRGLDRILAQHGLSGRFAVTVTADDAPSKPAPDMVVRATRSVGVAPARTVVVGDTTFDIGMAKAAGAKAIGVTWGYHPAHHLEAAGADTLARTMSDIPDLVNRLLP
jgi:phosphoglycolate phosphatase